MFSLRKINLIVATDLKGGISRCGEIPWRIKEDYNFFLDVTKRQYFLNKKNVLIMGKNTWKALPDSSRGLKDRITIVVSNSMTNDELISDNKTGSETYLAKSLPNAMELCNKLSIGKPFICGGSQIYAEALKTLQIDEIYLTKIDHDYQCDNFFPLNLLKLKDDDPRDTFMLDDSSQKVKVTFIRQGMMNMNVEESQYLNLLKNILSVGDFKQTRNAKTWSVFGKTMEFDLEKGFPLLTTKKVFMKGIFEELLFFLKGDTNANHLAEKNVKIWEGNTNREFLDANKLNHYAVGDMGSMYGFNLVHFGAEYDGMDKNYDGQGFNQIEYCLNLLKTDPFSRRIIMTTYNPAKAHEGVLYPCHGLSIIFSVDNNYRLSCMMTQRSADIVCGVPFNIASYALLVNLFCEVVNNDPNYTGHKFTAGRLIMNFADVHIYESHYSQVVRQILREPFVFPKISFKRKLNVLTDFVFDDLIMQDYVSYPGIIAKMVA
uniref:thymidylate synthase n=1 Tax=viral metagenome TaxID=1070528 RepID=A0A6C0C777_9ZZZZ